MKLPLQTQFQQLTGTQGIKQKILDSTAHNPKPIPLQAALKILKFKRV